MDCNFIKDILKPVASDLKADNSALESFIEGRENSFILKHNISTLSQLLGFLDSPDNIFILNGFMGSGKTYLTECLIDFVSEDVLIFRNSYNEASNLDDILLSMFKDFSIYHGQRKIILPKTETNIFSEKINSYIKYCNLPMLFIFDSFEINMRSNDRRKDILDFINFLSRFERIKIIICSRTFKQKDLISDNSSLSASPGSITAEEMYEYLEQNNIKGSKYECEELYKVTRGHYLLLELSVFIMSILDISLTIFSTEYKKSAKNFLEFLISKILSISSEKFIKPLLLLSILRHGASADFLVNQKIASVEEIDFLVQKHVVTEKFGRYYLKDYIKNEFIKSVSNETKMNAHKYIVNVYEEELQLKPFERELFLSRQTMRQEIDFHLKKIETLEQELEKSGKIKLANTQELTYLSYVHTSGYKSRLNTSSDKKYINKNRKNPGKNSRFQLSKEDTLLLNAAKTQDNITKQLEAVCAPYTQNFDEPEEIQDFSRIPQSLDDYIEIAQNYEEAFNFSSAIMYYKKALTYKNDEMFNLKEPVIYTKLAICYKKIQNIDEAVKNYEIVYDLYIKDFPDKAYEVLLSIAQTYCEVYKFDKVKETYNRILYSQTNVPIKTKIRALLDMAELEDNNSNPRSAVIYLQNALKTAQQTPDIPLLSECYFKYALLLDDMNNTDLALKYYLRCIQTSADIEVNPHLACAYSNLADISRDNGNISAAKMYYELSVEADKKRNNYEGLYYSYSKSAEIYRNEDPQKSYELLVKALSAAKKLDDLSYAVSAYVEIGDYYMSEGDYKHALKSYILALNMLPADSAEEITGRINAKINKIKIIKGESEFIKFMNEIKKKK